MDNEILKRLEALEKEVKDLKKPDSDAQKTSPLPFKTIEKLQENRMVFGGRYVGNNVGSTFGHDNLNILKVLELDDDKISKVLNALANKERLKILKAVMKEQLTINEIMEKCGFNTTGQAYHHVNALEKGGFVVKKNDRVVIVGNKISAFLLALASVYQFLNSTTHAPINVDDMD
ncbi:MAG: helix-turn-helix domain-containing protein [Spirochaetales bacterium]